MVLMKCVIAVVVTMCGAISVRANRVLTSVDGFPVRRNNTMHVHEFNLRCEFTRAISFIRNVSCFPILSLFRHSPVAGPLVVMIDTFERNSDIRKCNRTNECVCLATLEPRQKANSNASDWRRHTHASIECRCAVLDDQLLCCVSDESEPN